MPRHPRTTCFALLLCAGAQAATIEIGPGDNFLGMPYPPHGIYDVTRAKNELGFKAEYDVDRAVDDYIASLERMRAQGI